MSPDPLPCPHQATEDPPPPSLSQGPGHPLIEVEPLLALPLFRDLDQETLEGLARRCLLRRFRAGEKIVKAGEPWDFLLLVKDGSVLVSQQRLGLCPQVLDEVGPGQPLALMPVLDQQPCPATIEGHRPGVLVLVPGAAFRETLEQRPNLALRLLSCIARRFRRLTELAGALSLLTLEERLCLFLHRHAPAAELPPGGIPRNWTMSHEELGQRVGGSREEITRTLARLRKQGLIRVARRRVEVLDRQALAQRVPELPGVSLL